MGTASGCPRCGSEHLSQKEVTTAGGWMLVVVAVLLSCWTFGLSLLLIIPACFCHRPRSSCKACGWRIS